MEQIGPENEEGCVEYKRKLTKLSAIRFQQLLTQMKWRLQEGNGQATYYIGIEDDGKVSNISSEELDESINTFKELVSNADSEIKDLKIIGTSAKYAKIQIQKKYNKCPEIRIALIGETGHGKSSLISHLLYNENDDGKGSSRIKICRHSHELLEGKTSSVGCYFIGIKEQKIVNFTNDENADTILKKSEGIITLIDLPGYERYSKSLYYGLFSYKPHYVLYLISSQDNFDQEKFQQKVAVCCFFQIPFIIIITKQDTYNFEFEEMIKKMVLNHDLFINDTIKIMSVSVKNGYQIEELKKYLVNITESFLKLDREQNQNEDNLLDKIFMINDVMMNKNIGIIVNGIVLNGVIKVHDKLVFGPDKQQVIVKSIHINHQPHLTIDVDDMASLVIEQTESKKCIIDKYTNLYDEHVKNIASSSDKLSLVKEYIIYVDTSLIQKMYVLFMDNIVETILITQIIDESKYQYRIKFLTNIFHDIKPFTKILLKNNENNIFLGVVIAKTI